MLVTLSACTSQSIYYDKKFNPPVYFGTHVVRQGETMYSIARRYGRDYKELAAANNIQSPYTISPGTKIHLEKVFDGYTGSATEVKKQVKENVNVTKRKVNKEKSNLVTKVKKHKNFKNIKWSWPHVGPILAMYRNSAKSERQANINKGIDIGGRDGDPIYAAASGEVVYAGNGLLGYGNLVIINHNAQYLSAYAHNRKILVKEGQKIQAGQKIAEMGDSGAERTMLHFEIRRNGQPVDPLRYLPGR